MMTTETKFCSNCGDPLTWGVPKCPNCGASRELVSGLGAGSASRHMGTQAEAAPARKTPTQSENAIFSPRRTVNEEFAFHQQKTMTEQPHEGAREIPQLHPHRVRTVPEGAQFTAARTVPESTGSVRTVPEGWAPLGRTVPEGRDSAVRTGAHNTEQSGAASSNIDRHVNSPGPAPLGATVFIGQEGETSTRLAGWLICISGPLAGRDFRVVTGKNSVGRHPASTIMLSDSSVSSNHAVFWIDGHKATIVDSNSSNGIIINSERVFGPTVLEKNDAITLGLLTLVWYPFEPPAGMWS